MTLTSSHDSTAVKTGPRNHRQSSFHSPHSTAVPVSPGKTTKYDARDRCPSQQPSSGEVDGKYTAALKSRNSTQRWRLPIQPAGRSSMVSIQTDYIAMWHVEDRPAAMDGLVPTRPANHEQRDPQTQVIAYASSPLMTCHVMTWTCHDRKKARTGKSGDSWVARHVCIYVLRYCTS